jgi:Flp pilus assembly protein TadD
MSCDIRLFLVAVMLAAACSPDEAKHKAAGNILFRRGDVSGAAREYSAALKANPNDANARTLLGNALFELGRSAEAEREYERALALDPGARSAARGLVTLQLRAGHTAEARARLEAMVQKEPRDYETQASLGRLLYQSGDLDGAERHLRDALTYAQNDPSALYTLGLVLARKKDAAQAGAIFDRLEAVTPDKAYAPYGRAVAAVAVGHSDEALRWLAIALGRGVDDLGSVEHDEALAPLQTLPRFGELLSAARGAARGRAPPKKGGPGP